MPPYAVEFAFLFPFPFVVTQNTSLILTFWFLYLSPLFLPKPFKNFFFLCEILLISYFLTRPSVCLGFVLNTDQELSSCFLFFNGGLFQLISV